MSLERAQRQCVDIRVLEPAPGLYERAQRALLSEALHLSPRVEAAGPGHVFVDLSGTGRLWGGAVDCGAGFQKRIVGCFGLPAAVGIAASKLISKVATRVIKPAGLCQVPGGCEEHFLAPLPLHILPGIDAKILCGMRQFNILKISDLNGVSPAQIREALGECGSDIYRMAKGQDAAPVLRAGEPAPKVYVRTTLSGQSNDEAVLERELFLLAIRAGRELRAMAMGALRLVLTIWYSDATNASLCRKLTEPLSGELSLADEFCGMLRVLIRRRIRLNSIKIECSDLCYPYGGEACQINMFDAAPGRRERESRLMGALDRVRTAFGEKALAFGRARH